MISPARKAGRNRADQSTCLHLRGRQWPQCKRRLSTRSQNNSARAASGGELEGANLHHGANLNHL